MRKVRIYQPPVIKSIYLLGKGNVRKLEMLHTNSGRTGYKCKLTAWLVFAQLTATLRRSRRRRCVSANSCWLLQLLIEMQRRYNQHTNTLNMIIWQRAPSTECLCVCVVFTALAIATDHLHQYSKSDLDRQHGRHTRTATTFATTSALEMY